jgi:U3 small nucleolar RNA-associated protein 4
MAANPQNTMLALGCDDGSVRIVSLWDGEFEHVRKFSAVKTRILSIAWGPMQIKGSPLSLPKKLRKAETPATPAEPIIDSTGKIRAVDFEDVVLVTGCADSSVRVWDARSGMCRSRMTTDKIEGEQTLVWSVAVLQDGTIVSGDSLGIVAFWDSKTYTQIQNIKPHQADVLALTIGSDGKTIFSSGVDQHVVQLQRTLIEDSSLMSGMQGKQNRNRDRTRWTVANTKRYHSHDVRALSISPPYSLISHITPIPSSSAGIAAQKRQLPILVSGGLDFTVVYNTMSAESGQAVRQLAGSKTRLLDPSSNNLNRASYIPARNAPIHLASEAKLISKVRPGGVDIYRVGKEEAILEMEIKVSWPQVPLISRTDLSVVT